MNEDKTSPEEFSNPEKHSEQPTLVTSGEKYLSADPEVISRNEKVLNRELEAPWLTFLKWFGPVVFVSFLFLVWVFFDRVKRQKLFIQTSQINSLLLESVDSLSKDQTNMALAHLEKAASILPEEPRLRAIEAQLVHKINRPVPNNQAPKEAIKSVNSEAPKSLKEISKIPKPSSPKKEKSKTPKKNTLSKK